MTQNQKGNNDAMSAIRKKVVEFVELLFASTPQDIKKAWGMKVWEYFNTALWKALSTTITLDAMVSEYFRLLGSVSPEIISFIDSNRPIHEKMLALLDDEMLTIIGRVQYNKKAGGK